jgi:hypothetical protein
MFNGCEEEDIMPIVLSYIPSINPVYVASMSGREINPYTSKADWDKIQERENQTIDKKFTKM